MAARFQADWFDIDGASFRITIYDDSYTGGAVEQTLDGAVPGFELAYESEADQPYQGIIASTLTVHLVNNGGAFDTWLQSIPSISGENDVRVVLERNTPEGQKLEWAGIIMVDQIEMEDAPNPSRVKLTANDGTAFLKTVRTVPTGTTSGGITFLTSPNIIQWLHSILNRIPTSTHWPGTGVNFLRAWTDLKPDNFGESVANGGQGSQGLNILHQSNLTGALDPNSINVLNGAAEAYTDWTFLQSLCMLFNARLCLANGEWHFFPVNQHLMQADGTDYRYFPKIYSRQSAQFSTALSQTQAELGEFYNRTTPQLGPPTTAGRYVQMAGGSISHTIPLKSFRRSRPYRANTYLHNTIRIGSTSAINVADNGLDLVDIDAPQSFFTGAIFKTEGSILVSRNAQSGFAGPADFASVRIKYNLDVGAYRYDPANETWTTDQTTDRYFFVGGLGYISDGFDANVPFSIQTQGLPADSETLQLEIDADFISGVGTSLNNTFSAASPATNLGCFITTSLINDAYEDKLVFQGETSNDNTEAFNQGTLVFGTVDHLGSNSGNLTAGNFYQSGPVSWDMGTWTSHFSSTGEHLNRLCVREAIALLQSGLPKREGQIRIPSGARIPSPLMTIENEEGTAHFMVTSCTYSADQRIASISRLQVGALDLTDVSDNGTEGEVSDGNDNEGSGSGGSGGGATDDDGTTSTLPGPTAPSNSGHGVIGLMNKLQKNLLFGDDGILKITAKSGELPIDADAIDDSTSTKKLTSQAEKDDITDLKGALKTTTGSGGKGVFINTNKTETESHVAVDSTTAKMQAGSRTLVDLSETSPGVISMKVQAGDGSGSPASVEGMRIEGHSTFQNAAVTFPQPVTFSSTVSGINATNITGIDDAGSGEIITDAERTKLNGIETGAEVNVVTTNLATADQTLPANRTIQMNNNFLTFMDGQATKLQYNPNSDRFHFSGGLNVSGELNALATSGMSSGQVKFREPAMGGSSGVILQAPSTNMSADVTFTLPDADGSAGQFIKTDGSGNLSFASASGGSGSAPYVLASHSGRAPLYFHSRYYYGSSSFGWATNSPSTQQTGTTSLNDQYAHAGIILPTDCSAITFKSSIRNDSRADDVRVHLWVGSRPNGSTSNITLSEIGNATASCSSGQDLHYNADISASSLSLTAGQMLFVALYRVGSVTGTTNVNYTYTLMITP